MSGIMDVDELQPAAANSISGDDVTDKMAIVTVEHSKNAGNAMGRDNVIKFLDSIDNRVETLRKEALHLQDTRDELHIRIDLLKNTDLLSNLNESDKEEVDLQLKRINKRLQTVDINVQTVRDHSQVDSLSVINNLIDEIIRHHDPISKRQKCLEFLNACTTDFQYSHLEATFSQTTITFIDKKFEGHLLGCTLDDQKRIKKRLEALLNYMVSQSISD